MKFKKRNFYRWFIIPHLYCLVLQKLLLVHLKKICNVHVHSVICIMCVICIMHLLMFWVCASLYWLGWYIFALRIPLLFHTIIRYTLRMFCQSIVVWSDQQRYVCSETSSHQARDHEWKEHCVCLPAATPDRSATICKPTA